MAIQSPTTIGSNQTSEIPSNFYRAPCSWTRTALLAGAFAAGLFAIGIGLSGHFAPTTFVIDTTATISLAVVGGGLILTSTLIAYFTRQTSSNN